MTTRNASKPSAKRQQRKRSAKPLPLDQFQRELKRLDREVAKLKPGLDDLPRLLEISSEAFDLMNRHRRMLGLQPLPDPDEESE